MERILLPFLLSFFLSLSFWLIYIYEYSILMILFFCALDTPGENNIYIITGPEFFDIWKRDPITAGKTCNHNGLASISEWFKTAYIAGGGALHSFVLKRLCRSDSLLNQKNSARWQSTDFPASVTSIFKINTTQKYQRNIDLME